MKKLNLILILSVILAGGSVLDAHAAIYFVNGTTGVNDSTHGSTAAKPFKTIQYALAKSNATEIRIAAGNYTGPFTVPENRVITLKGAGIAKTFLNGDNKSPVVSADGPTKLTLTALTIQYGTNGLWGRMAYLYGNGIRVTNNSSHGIYAKGNSYLSLENSTASSNGGEGVRVHSSSAGDIVHCNVTSNTSAGIRVTNASYGYIDNCTTSNNARGVYVTGGSTAYLMNNRVYSNSLLGVDINSHSSAGFGGGNKIHDNADNSGWRPGVGIFQGSAAYLTPEVADNPDEIYQNKGPGINVSSNSDLFLQSASVHNNNSDGVRLWLGSSSQISGGEIFQNTGQGIGVSNSSSLYLNGGSVHNNTGNGVLLGAVSTGQFSTTANIDNNGLFGINCSGGTGLATGDAGSVSGNGSGQTNCQGWTP